tara:strand:- start:3835 stop:5118 length:1284 start_codon:yes stop_codon:yes gene_type:complete
MISAEKNKIDIFLKLLIYAFPVFIILGPFALNFFSIIFSIYALFNFKKLIKFNFINNKILIFFFSFIFFIFPFQSIEFENSFIKYISFFRFVLMLFGLIIFFELQKNIIFFIKIYKIYIAFLIIITIDVLIEYNFGSNIMGYSSYYSGRIASFTNDELIIGYIYCFLALFTLTFLYKKTNYYYFFFISCAVIIISFFIGERSNLIKLSLLIISFSFIHFFYLKKLGLKYIILFFTIILVFFTSLYFLTKNTSQANKLFFIDNLIISKNEKISFNFKGRFYGSNHAAHYLTAYEIFLNHPIFGIGINNFHKESSKEKYDNKKLEKTITRASTHPHQLYLEVVSEVGLLGLIYFIFIFFYPIYISIKSFFVNREILIVSHLFLHLYFIFPILPSGSIFGTNYGIPFWFNLAILLYFSKRNELFNLKNHK